MDNQELSQSDFARIGEIKPQGFESNLAVIRATQGGFRSELTRKDFELLRQDRRRAQAAYPNVSADKIVLGTWFSVSVDSEIADSFCPSGNSNGTMKNGKWYLDGGCYTGIVRSTYPNRADAATTATYFDDLRERQKAAKLEQLKKDGPFVVVGGSGGSLSVKLDKKTNQVIIVAAEEWATSGTEWRMPFVAEQWADINPGDLTAIKGLPSFTQSTERVIKVQPTGVRVVAGMTGVTVSGSPGTNSSVQQGNRNSFALTAKGIAAGTASSVQQGNINSFRTTTTGTGIIAAPSP
jgi:hypothetical protein